MYDSYRVDIHFEELLRFQQKVKGHRRRHWDLTEADMLAFLREEVDDALFPELERNRSRIYELCRHAYESRRRAHRSAWDVVVSLELKPRPAAPTRSWWQHLPEMVAGWASLFDWLWPEVPDWRARLAHLRKRIGMTLADDIGALLRECEELADELAAMYRSMDQLRAPKKQSRRRFSFVLYLDQPEPRQAGWSFPWPWHTKTGVHG